LTKPLLSLIIPAYNEEMRLPHTLQLVMDYLASQPYQAEVLVVENGSHDRTLEIAQGFAWRYPNLCALHSDQRGKGLAVRKGMLAAQGQYRFMCDADFSMPVEQIGRFLPPVLDGYDIAIASREAPGAVRYNEPAYRHMVGRVFNAMIHALALPGLNDTQCGFKCFRAPVARDLFPRQILPGWSFDVEVLFIARQRGYRIVELPIPWYFNAESKVRVFRDSAHMALDLLTIRINALRGVYNRNG